MDRMTVFWVMIAVASAIMIAGVGLNVSLWLRGRDDWRAVLRSVWGALSSRRILAYARTLVRDGLLHSRVYREDRLRWAMHSSLLWGFAVLFVLSTLTGLAVEILIPFFNVHLPIVDAFADKDTPWLALLNELCGLVILAGAGIAIYRRYRVKPANLRTQNQDTVLLSLIGLVIATGYPLEAVRILAERVPASRAVYGFVGYVLSLAIAPLDAPWEAVHYWAFMLHAVIASAFIAYIPFSKTFHVVVSPLVAAIDNLPSAHGPAMPAPAKVSKTSAATADPLGLYSFEFRQLMELDACTRCGQCIPWCPTFNESKDESVHPLGKIEREKGLIRNQFGPGALLLGKRNLDGKVAELSKGLYRCTLCARCAEVCSIGLRTRDLWLGMREQMVRLGQYPDAFNRLRDTVATARNISGDVNTNRMLWSNGLPTKPDGLIGKRSAETVYFIGCVGAMFPAAYGIPQSLSQTLARAGVDFTTLGGEEWCCGFPLILAGMRDAAIELMRHNVETVRAIGAKRLVASCPSCFHTWHSDYPRMLGEPLGFEVMHSTQYLAEMIERKQITLGKLEQKVTYHDPCDLGRTSGIFDEPRFIFQQVPGLQLIEMEDHRERALCCGGGGDMEMAEPDLTAAVAKRRVGQAQATGAQVIASACQQCKRTLSTAVRKEKMRVKVLDITEVVWNSSGAG